MRKHTFGASPAQLKNAALPLLNLETYAYDEVGRLTAAENANARLRFAYDPAGRLVEAENESLGEAFRYSYDAFGNRLSATRVASGRTTNYEYGTRNELITIRDADHNYTSFAYDANLRETNRRLPNGVEIARTYDEAGRLLTVSPQRWGSNRGEDARGYLYNSAGQITARIDERGRVRTYEYDEAGRVSRVQYPFAEQKKWNDLLEQVRVGSFGTHFDVREGTPEQELDPQRGGLGDLRSAPDRSGWTPPGQPSETSELPETMSENQALRNVLPLDLQQAEHATDPAQFGWGYRGRPGATEFASRADLSPIAGDLQDTLQTMTGRYRPVNTRQLMWTEEFEYDERGNRTPPGRYLRGHRHG